jgi:hypothetical protein
MRETPKKGPNLAKSVDFLAPWWKGIQWPRMKDLPGGPAAIIKFPAVERSVFGALCCFANPDTAKWPPWVPKCQGFVAWPSVATLMDVTGLSERAVQGALAKLRMKRAISCLFESKGGASRCYLLTPHHLAGYKRETPQDVRQHPAPPAPEDKAEEQVLQAAAGALSHYVPTDQRTVSSLVERCRAKAPDCTEEQIVDAVHVAADRMRNSKEPVRSPGGFLLKVTPECLIELREPPVGSRQWSFRQDDPALAEYFAAQNEKVLQKYGLAPEETQ